MVIRQSRRDFVRRCASAVGGASLARGAMAATAQAPPDGPITNWAGNFTYSAKVTDASSLDQVQAFVRGNVNMRVLGTRHCFNSIADSTSSLLSVRPMHDVVALDRDAKTVTV